MTAYFDDSGTHDDSPFVLLGGLYATDEQWKVFDLAWREKLAEPVPHKPPLKRFHMFDCHHGDANSSAIHVPSGMRSFTICVIS